METSILTSIKKLLGIPAEIVAFDEDIAMHINSAFSALNLIGVGPAETYSITGNTEKWTDFSTTVTNSIKTYIFLTVKLVFDPPQTSFVIASMEKQIEKLEYTMNVIEDEAVVYE